MAQWGPSAGSITQEKPSGARQGIRFAWWEATSISYRSSAPRKTGPIVAIPGIEIRFLCNEAPFSHFLPWTEVTSRAKNRPIDKSSSRKCNRYRTRERSRPTFATNALAISKKQPRQAIDPIELVSYNSETLSEKHYRKCFSLFKPSSLNAFAAKTHHGPCNAISHAASDAVFY